MDTVEVFVQNSVSPDVRVYEVFGSLICSVEEAHFTFPITRMASDSKRWKSIGPVARNIISKLHGVEGIYEICIGHSVLIVIKYRTETWEYIEPDIIHTLEIVLGHLEIIDG